MEKFLTVWKVSGQSGKFPDSLESFQTAQKVYRQSGKKKLLFSTVSLHKSMEPYRYTINLFFVCAWVDEYKLSKSCRYIKTCRENNLRTLVNVAKTIYALLAHMSRKQFTHFVRKVFARKSLPTGKLRLFRSLGQTIFQNPQSCHGVVSVQWDRYDEVDQLM